MMMNDPLGDMLTRIRNAQTARQVDRVHAGVQAARLGARRAGR